VILADSSAWIEFDRATGSPAHRRLRQAIASGEELATVGMVVLELLAGARTDEYVRELQRLLARCRFLPLQEPSDEEAGASIYRACRRGGETVRRLPDCLIAAVAIRTGAKLLHQDADFDVIARFAPLELVPVS
jgi:predicted nucleic acid-binding protein